MAFHVLCFHRTHYAMKYGTRLFCANPAHWKTKLSNRTWFTDTKKHALNEWMKWNEWMSQQYHWDSRFALNIVAQNHSKSQCSHNGSNFLLKPLAPFHHNHFDLVSLHSSIFALFMSLISLSLSLAKADNRNTEAKRQHMKTFQHWILASHGVRLNDNTFIWSEFRGNNQSLRHTIVKNVLLSKRFQNCRRSRIEIIG